MGDYLVSCVRNRSSSHSSSFHKIVASLSCWKMIMLGGRLAFDTAATGWHPDNFCIASEISEDEREIRVLSSRTLFFANFMCNSCTDSWTLPIDTSTKQKWMRKLRLEDRSFSDIFSLPEIMWGTAPMNRKMWALQLDGRKKMLQTIKTRSPYERSSMTIEKDHTYFECYGWNKNRILSLNCGRKQTRLCPTSTPNTLRNDHKTFHLLITKWTEFSLILNIIQQLVDQ